MIQHTEKNIPLWRFEHLLQHEEISHYVSSREGGVSAGNYATLNLGYTSGDVQESVDENRNRLATALGITDNNLVFPQQIHSSNIYLISDTENIQGKIRETDGLLTQKPGLYLSVLTADCVPVIFFDPAVKAIGVAHAGWRGTVQNITGKMIDRFMEEFNSNPVDILAGIGPSIGPEVYEVGTNVIEAVHKQFGDNAKYLLREKGSGKAYLDLWKANRIQLEGKGVPANHIETAAICTYTNYIQFFSARRLGIQCGRFGAGIMLKTE
ncbi:MAG: peptidoglycan editing factor PgeF [Bacteroidales bacterium]